MKTFQSTPLTFIDQTDSRKLEVYIKSNLPTVQIYNSNTGAYTPDWREGEKLTLTTDVFLDSRVMTTEEYSSTLIKWYIDEVSDSAEITSNRNIKTLQIATNELATSPIITYICEATYQGITASMRLTFTRVDTGLNGEAGADGTSIRILGTADSVALVSGTNYYTITYSAGTVVAAELGDAYIYNGELYVCSVLNGDGTTDYFVNVGSIQGPKGEDAKSIVLSGNSQTFKISKTNVITPSTITVVAQVSNTSITSWSYSVNGGQTFLSTIPSGVVRDGSIVTITGSTLSTNSLVIKASDGTIEDVFTVYKVSDGADGSDGDKGDPAPLAFLTNENISFAADENGQVPLATFTTNVVAYKGTTKVTPVLGTITGLPSGMTVSEPVTTLNEQILTFSIANNSTLGSVNSNSGTITIPVTSPVSTNLKLSWSKINTGHTGVGVSSTTVSYGVSDAASAQPTEWQSTIPIVADGKYLWTRTIIDYTDEKIPDTVTYIYAKQGIKGDSGTAGSSVTVSSIQYQAGTSATTAPTGIWSDSVVAVSEGNYLWTKTTFSDGKVAYGVTKQGQTGSTGAMGMPGTDAVTFQIYSSNGYALSINTPTVTLQTFAYIGDIAITAGATYQWYVYNDSEWTAISGGTNAYLTITREDVAFSKSYMCKMTFNGVEYTSVATIDDKNDENKVFTTKPSNYSAGDLWIVGVDYAPAGVVVGTLLRAEHTNVTYGDVDWVTATKYDKELNDLRDNIETYNQYFSFDSTEGLKISAKDNNGTPSQFSTSLTNERLSFNYGNEAIAYINGTKMNIKEAEIESPLTVTGKYSGSTMLQAPVINIGNFSIIVESNGSLSIAANT